MGTFKKGFILGSLLGAGMVWLNATKKGRLLRDEILDQAALIYSKVLKQIQDSGSWEQLTKHKYVMMVKDTVNAYTAEHALPAQVKATILSILANQWSRLKKDAKAKKKNKK
ncbi:MAG: YtxH domain-containing protein [Candidatus Magasanikbacteria bacterium]|nr:YtxH domain-containing protein [Candidatus Magasanikbacteria bacterium]